MYHRQYNRSIIVPKLMHDPHAGDDAEKEENQDDHEESYGEAENSRSPVALVAGHFGVVLLSVVMISRVSFLENILRKRKRRTDEMLLIMIRLELKGGVADLALPGGSPLCRVCLTIPAL